MLISLLFLFDFIYFLLSTEDLVALTFPKNERETEDVVEDESYDA